MGNIGDVRGPYVDYSGKRFNYLTILWPCGWRNGGQRINGRRRYRIVWACQCDCGTITTVYAADFKRSLTKSCGCKKVAKHNVNAHNLFAQYRHKAKARGIEWALTFDQFLKITEQPCYFTGWLPTQSVHRKVKRHPPYLYNGIDRLDNTKGYTLQNAVACNGDVNKAKLAMTEERFIALCRAVVVKHGGYKCQETA